MFNCLILEIPHILRGEKAKHHYCLGKESTNTTNERLERIMQRNLLVLFQKPCKTPERRLIKEFKIVLD
jgi:hypothetical protein